MTTLEEQFDAAAEKARQIQGVSNANKLRIYGLFKQATEGPVGDRPRPGIFDPTGRAKYDAWKELGDLVKEDAMQQYVAFVESL